MHLTRPEVSHVPGRQTLPMLVPCFPRGGAGRTPGRVVPSQGLVLGRDGRPLDFLERGQGRVRVTPEGKRLRVEELTASGVRVNGEATGGARTLEVGDVLRVDDGLFVFTFGTEAPPVAPRDGLVGSSEAMQAVRRSVEAVAARKHAVVVTGETGTGKEVVAHLLHDRSGRTGAYVAVNCSTFTDELLASELFGHARGAFTGAVSEHAGLFRAARGGSLLLDELAEIPAPVQAALLRVLETQSVRPVGATKDVDIDVRVIATTNCELVELVQAGRFRADLYARLAQWTIRVPPLRSRREDIPELVAHLLPRVDGAGRRLSIELAHALLVHEWPLNVRGLLNVLSIAVVSAQDADGPLTLTPEVADALERTRSMALATTVPPAEERSTTSTTPWTPSRSFDREELEALMTRFEGHVAAAARHAGITRPKMYRLLGVYGIDPEAYRPHVGR